MKRQSYLTAILASAAIAGSALFVATNPAEACWFSKTKDSSTAVDGIGKSPTFVAKDYSDKLGIGAAGIAAIAGLIAAGITYKTRATKTEAATTQLETEPEVSTEYTVEQVLTGVTVDELPESETLEGETALVK